MFGQPDSVSTQTVPGSRDFAFINSWSRSDDLTLRNVFVTYDLCSANASKRTPEWLSTQNSSVWFQTQFFHDLERIEVGNQTNAAFAIKYWAIIGKHSIFQHFRSYHVSMSVHVQSSCTGLFVSLFLICNRSGMTLYSKSPLDS